MKQIILFLLISFFLLVNTCESTAQINFTYDNESLYRLMTYRIMLKKNIEAEAKLIKEKKVKKIFLKSGKNDEWSNRIMFYDRNGLLTARYSFDSLQTPENEIRIVYDSINKPFLIVQNFGEGGNIVSKFYYKGAKIGSIFLSGDSLSYTVCYPEYADNEGDPLLKKIKMVSTDDDYYYINFKYNEAGKLIRVYEEGSPDIYIIKHEPDKVTVSGEDETAMMEFKNDLLTRITFDFDKNTQQIVYEYKYGASGLKESSTMTYKNKSGKTDSFTEYFVYEYYK